MEPVEVSAIAKMLDAIAPPIVLVVLVMPVTKPVRSAGAAAAAPPERTGFATGMTNATKTIGGAIASAIFAIALSSTGSIDDPTEGHAPLSGYLTVWAVCSVTALVAAASLLVVPKGAFAD